MSSVLGALANMVRVGLPAAAGVRAKYLTGQDERKRENFGIMQQLENNFFNQKVKLMDQMSQDSLRGAQGREADAGAYKSRMAGRKDEEELPYVGPKAKADLDLSNKQVSNFDRDHASVRNNQEAQSDYYHGNAQESRAHARYLDWETEQGKKNGGKAMTENQRLANEARIRGQYEGNPAYKTGVETANSYRTLKSFADVPDNDPSRPMADVSMIYNFMKFLDPTSTVRDTEAATVSNARGVPDGIRATWNRLKRGEKLTPDQRKAIISVIDQSVASRRQGVNSLMKQYGQIARTAGVDSANVAMDPFEGIGGGSSKRYSPNNPYKK